MDDSISVSIHNPELPCLNSVSTSPLTSPMPHTELQLTSTLCLMLMLKGLSSGDTSTTVGDVPMNTKELCHGTTEHIAFGAVDFHAPTMCMPAYLCNKQLALADMGDFFTLWQRRLLLPPPMNPASQRSPPRTLIHVSCKFAVNKLLTTFGPIDSHPHLGQSHMLPIKHQTMVSACASHGATLQGQGHVYVRGGGGGLS